MAKKSSVERNKKRLRLSQTYAKRYQSLKNKIMDKELAPDVRFQMQLVLAALPRNASRVRYRNRCLLTGRSRGFYRHFKLSRIKLRDLASMGLLPGVVKASW